MRWSPSGRREKGRMTNKSLPIDRRAPWIQERDGYPGLRLMGSTCLPRNAASEWLGRNPTKGTLKASPNRSQWRDRVGFEPTSPTLSMLNGQAMWLAAHNLSIAFSNDRFGSTIDRAMRTVLRSVSFNPTPFRSKSRGAIGNFSGLGVG